jgi:hypothetical protein
VMRSALCTPAWCGFWRDWLPVCVEGTFHLIFVVLPAKWGMSRRKSQIVGTCFPMSGTTHRTNSV